MTKQNLVTICCPLRWDSGESKRREDALNKILDGYGNPLGRSAFPDEETSENAMRLAQQLDDCANVHFMSLSVVPSSYPDDYSPGVWSSLTRSKKYCAHLILEMSADLSEAEAIKQLTAECGDSLRPIFEEAAGIKTNEELRRYLKRHCNKLSSTVPAIGSFFPKRATGLGFNGAPGLSVEVIKKDAALYNAIRADLNARRIVKNKQEREQQDEIRRVESRVAFELYQDLQKAFTVGEFGDHIKKHSDPAFAKQLNNTSESAVSGPLGLLGLVRAPILLVTGVFALIAFASFSPNIRDEVNILSNSQSSSTKVSALELVLPKHCDFARDDLQEIPNAYLDGWTEDELLEYEHDCSRQREFAWSVLLDDSDDLPLLEISALDQSNLVCEISQSLDDLNRPVFEKTQQGRNIRSFFESSNPLPVLEAFRTRLKSEYTRSKICNKTPDNTPPLGIDWHKVKSGMMREFYVRSLNQLIATKVDQFDYCSFASEANAASNFKNTRVTAKRSKLQGYINKQDPYFEEDLGCSRGPLYGLLFEDIAYGVSQLFSIVSATIVLTALSWLIFGYLSWKALRRSEDSNDPMDYDPDPEMVREMLMRENRTPAQNHMISITTVLPEWHRRWLTLPLAFQAVQMSIKRRWFRSGFLADIGTIHFARWVRLPGTKKLIFYSNYDANWESYLEDFITKAPEGLTGIWSNCVGFPKTENLFLKGAEDGDRFKRWARKSMIPTRFWYTAYEGLSIEQIRRNALVRIGLTQETNKSHAKSWINFFDSNQRPDQTLERDEIQTLVMRAGRELIHGKCLVINFPETHSVNELRDWVREMRSHVTTGDRKPEEAIYLSFSAKGLEKLGMHESFHRPAQATVEPNEPKFPSAFALGMDHDARKNVLGDKGENAPSNWLWGQQSDEATSADAVVLLYGKQSNDIARLNKMVREICDSRSVVCIHEVNFKPLPEELNDPIREPFGWKDGISQPIIRGVGRRDRNDPVNTVEPGEFILGYRDNRGFYPTSPTVDKETDSGDHLQCLPNPNYSNYPRYITDEERTEDDRYSLRDFGRNGSFLVIRQLAQDVEAFEHWLKKSADHLRAARGGDHDYITEEYVGAKIVGRWKDGAPITRWPYSPDMDPDRDNMRPKNAPASAKAQQTKTARPIQELSRTERARLENDFTYGDTDPQGHACPFGAHIRRANPRDSLNPDNANSIEIANRHRILRRGRPYGDDPEKPEGTFFMCLNADIERQFEFIQQNWINSARFHGLDNEVDPITGQTADGYSTFSIPSELGPYELPNWQSFIAMRGGGFFFLPGLSALDYLSTPVTPSS